MPRKYITFPVNSSLHNIPVNRIFMNMFLKRKTNNEVY